MSRLRWVAILLALGLNACRSTASGPLEPGPAASGPPPRLVPVDAAGLRQLTGGERTRLVMINVWAMWCEPCKEEIPDLIRLGEEFAPRGLALKFVTVDAPERQVEASAFLRDRGAAPPYYARSGKDMPFIEAFHPDWNGTLPATGLFEPDGTVVAFWDRPVDYATLHEVLEMFEWSEP